MLIAIWRFTIIKKKCMQVDSALVTRGFGVDDEALNEIHRLETGWSIGSYGIFLYSLPVTGILFILFRLYFANNFPRQSLSMSAALIDGMYGAIPIIVLYKFGWLRAGAVLVDRESLRVPCFRRVIVYDRGSPGTSVWIQRRSKQMYQCVVSDGERSSQLFLNERSAKILRIWAAGAPGDRAA